MPDPENRGFVRTAPGRFCPDGVRPAHFFRNFVWMGQLGHFLAQICPDWQILAEKQFQNGIYNSYLLRDKQ